MQMEFDPSQNYLERPMLSLDAVFTPKTIAIIGASEKEGSVGRTLTHNLLSSPFPGKIFPINPKRQTVLGKTCYPSLSAIHTPIDLAVIATPAATVPQLIKECAGLGVKAAIIISAGFKEQGADGEALEKAFLQDAKAANLRVIGPNCLGVMNPVYGMNATFAAGMALAGNIAFISQSGAMCTSVLDWSLQEHIGFSGFVSVGSMADVDWGDLISYFGNDPHTHSILIYMETIGNARAFLSAAREVALIKPIIVIKPGRTAAAAKAAASHTGSLAGSDEVFDAAMQRVGVLRVSSISELFAMANVLGKQPRPRGPRLAILTNAGGPAVLATDATLLSGGEIARLSKSTLDDLNSFLPKAWSHSNPIDILGDAAPATFAKTLEVVAQDDLVDGLLVILTPQDMTDPTKTAKAVAPFAHLETKPLLCSWMGGPSVKEGIDILSHSGVPTFSYSDDAAHAFGLMWRYSDNLSTLYETPTAKGRPLHKDRDKVASLIQNALQEGRTLLSEEESKSLLSCYGLPVVETHIAKTLTEALSLADQVGYPVVLKIYSHKITHKSDSGGVKLDLKEAGDVERAWKEIYQSVAGCYGKESFEGVTVQKMISKSGIELIIGSSVDPQFGPVVLFGTGGRLVEIYRDRALGLPPLNSTLAQRLIEQTKIAGALKGFRGQSPVDFAALENLLVSFALMLLDFPAIKECDINPLLATDDGFIALDARVLLFSQKETIPPPAIRPYPEEYIHTVLLKNGQEVVLRPIRSEDEPLLKRFHEELSEWSVRQRYLEPFSLDQRTAHLRLVRACFSDFDRDLTFIVEEPRDGKIIGIGRLRRLPSTQEANLTMVIADTYHGLGLGTELLQVLIETGKQEGVQTITAKVLSENTQMKRLLEHFGFQINAATKVMEAKLNLRPSS